MTVHRYFTPKPKFISHPLVRFRSVQRLRIIINDLKNANPSRVLRKYSDWLILIFVDFGRLFNNEYILFHF